MALHRTGTLLLKQLKRTVANKVGRLFPRTKNRGAWLSASFCRLGLRVWVVGYGWKFFDIVGFDEGTCGRRRLLAGIFGFGLAV